jgi:hypothetical protein
MTLNAIMSTVAKHLGYSEPLTQAERHEIRCYTVAISDKKFGYMNNAMAKAFGCSQPWVATIRSRNSQEISPVKSDTLRVLLLKCYTPDEQNLLITEAIASSGASVTVKDTELIIKSIQKRLC